MARPLGDYPFPCDLRSVVYRIDNRESGISYVGSALNFYKRWKRHHNELSNRTHGNTRFLRAWEKYGAEAFTWFVIEVTEPTRDALLSREQYWMDRLKAEGVGLYNVCVTAGSHLGVKRSDETKAKMSAIARERGDNGLVRDEEWRKAISEANRTNVATRCGPEMREKIAKIKQGNTFTKGLKYFHRDGVNKGLRPEEIEAFVADGWRPGRH